MTLANTTPTPRLRLGILLWSARHVKSSALDGSALHRGEALMADSTQAAAVLLKLYELRTEPALRQARAWFAFEFHPSTARDVLATWLGPGHESAPYRMVTSYWDMAASLVNQGAIPAEMFNEANTEHIALYAKLRPFLAEIRSTTKYPDYLWNLERVVGMMPKPEERIAIFERYMNRQRTLAAEGKQRAAYPETAGAERASSIHSHPSDPHSLNETSPD